MPYGIATVLSHARLTGAATTILNTPIAPGRAPYGSSGMGGGKQVIIKILRDRDGTSGALDGTIGIFGAFVPDSFSGSNKVVQRFLATGATNVFNTDGVNLVYVAPLAANYNWLVRIGGPQGTWATFNAAPSTQQQYGVTNPSGNVAAITIGGANLPVGTIVEVFYIAAFITVVAAAANSPVGGEFLSTDVMWAIETPTATNQSATLVLLEHEGR